MSLKWLMELTRIPTAAGKEQFVIAWVKQWVRRRSGLGMERDRAGNLLIMQGGTKRRGSQKAGRVKPVLITAHMDHPAFVVRDVERGGKEVEMEFRGGVHDPYFVGAKVEVISAEAGKVAARGRVVLLDAQAKPFKVVRARLAGGASDVRKGDIARWDLGRGLGRGVIRKGLLHAHACDDLAAVAAALSVLDQLRGTEGMEHVGVMLTRAEEIGFIGTLAACAAGSVPRDARLICLENSRSFADSPIGGGPILRVGDKASVFSPELTNRLTEILTEHANVNPHFKWQRKLMPGGTCEATAFSTYGYASTCVCLALGNYHNMVDIDGVLAGKRPARVGPEIISAEDYLGMIDLLAVSVQMLDSGVVTPLKGRLEKLLEKHSGVLAGH